MRGDALASRAETLAMVRKPCGLQAWLRARGSNADSTQVGHPAGVEVVLLPSGLDVGVGVKISDFLTLNADF